MPRSVRTIDRRLPGNHSVNYPQVWSVCPSLPGRRRAKTNRPQSEPGEFMKRRRSGRVCPSPEISQRCFSLPEIFSCSGLKMVKSQLQAFFNLVWIWKDFWSGRENNRKPRNTELLWSYLSKKSNNQTCERCFFKFWVNRIYHCWKSNLSLRSSLVCKFKDKHCIFTPLHFRCCG